MTPDPASLPAGPDRLLALLAAGRVTRGAWTGTDAEGRRTLCAALSDEVEVAESAGACPAELMPAWLAHLVVDIDDETSLEARDGLLLRLGRLSSRWGGSGRLAPPPRSSLEPLERARHPGVGGHPRRVALRVGGRHLPTGRLATASRYDTWREMVELTFDPELSPWGEITSRIALVPRKDVENLSDTPALEGTGA